MAGVGREAGSQSFLYQQPLFPSTPPALLPLLLRLLGVQPNTHGAR